jgi:hypothetical protein
LQFRVWAVVILKRRQLPCRSDEDICHQLTVLAHYRSAAVTHKNPSVIYASITFIISYLYTSTQFYTLLVHNSIHCSMYCLGWGRHDSADAVEAEPLAGSHEATTGQTLAKKFSI